MAIEIRVFDFTLVAGMDLTDSQYRFIKVDTDGRGVVAGNKELAVGVLQSPGDVDEAVNVRQLGITKLVAGATITPGIEIESDTDGAGVELTNGERLGIALAGAEAGEVFSIVLTG